MPGILQFQVTDFRQNQRMRHKLAFQPFFSRFLAAASTLVFRDFLKASRRFPMVLSDAPRIWAARMPAFRAPSRATVATGTPAGICKMESTESQPSIELEDFTGTPITGR